MAGLSCGYHLRKAGVRFAILESADSVGGRVQTDNVDGFLLDRGFQIFLTSYQEAQALLDYQSLDLQPFYAGNPAVTSTAGRAMQGLYKCKRKSCLTWAFCQRLQHSQGLWSGGTVDFTESQTLCAILRMGWGHCQTLWDHP